MSRTPRFRSWPSAASISAWRRAWSAASATPAISATRSGWRRNISAHVFETLMAAGEEFGIGLFGSRALNALRLEKNYGSWAREYRPIYGPLEAGLDRFVAYAQGGRFHRQGGGARRTQAGRQVAAARLHRRCRGRRRHRRRADLVRRRRARLGDLGRLRASMRKHRSPWAMCRRKSPTRRRFRDRAVGQTAMPPACSRRRCSTRISSGCAPDGMHPVMPHALRRLSSAKAPGPANTR